MLCEGGTTLSYTPHKHKSVVCLTTTDRRAVDAADAVDDDGRGTSGRNTHQCHRLQDVSLPFASEHLIPAITTYHEAHQT
jgi:hypothetical protein